MYVYTDALKNVFIYLYMFYLYVTCIGWRLEVEESDAS